MRKIFKFLFYVVLFSSVFYFRSEISRYILKNFVFKKEIILQETSKYKSNGNFEFVSSREDFIVNSKKEIFDTIYTVVDNGWNDFSFYCANEYTLCLDDVESIISDPYRLSYINNFVHPFNAYDKIHVSYSNLGRIEVKIDKLYSDEEVVLLEEKVDSIISSNISSTMNDREKIKTVHDFIINNTKYDTVRADAIENNLAFSDDFGSHKAIGPLVNGMGICGGYSDAMSLFLHEFGINSYRVSNDFHIWNFVNVDSEWLHLDLTWNDPVVSTGEDVLIDTYFLISDKQLIDLNDGKHTFDREIFSETENRSN